MTDSSKSRNYEVKLNLINREISEILDETDSSHIKMNEKFNCFIRDYITKIIESETKINQLKNDMFKLKSEQDDYGKMLENVISRYSIDIADFAMNFPEIIKKYPSLSTGDNQISDSTFVSVKKTSISELSKKIECQKIIFYKLKESYDSNLYNLFLKYDNCKTEIGKNVKELHEKSCSNNKLTADLEKHEETIERMGTEIENYKNEILNLVKFKTRYEKDYAPVFSFFVSKMKEFSNYLQSWQGKYKLIKKTVDYLIEERSKEKVIKSDFNVSRQIISQHNLDYTCAFRKIDIACYEKTFSYFQSLINICFIDSIEKRAVELALALKRFLNKSNFVRTKFEQNTDSTIDSLLSNLKTLYIFHSHLLGLYFTLKNCPLDSLLECIDRFDKILELEKKFDNYFCSETFDINNISHIIKHLTNFLSKINVENQDYDHESVKFYVDLAHFNIKYSLHLLNVPPIFLHSGSETINLSPLSSLPDVLLKLKSFNVNRFEISAPVIRTISKFASDSSLFLSNLNKSISDISIPTEDVAQMFSFAKEFINTVNEYRNILDNFLNMNFSIKQKPSIVGIKIKSILNKIVSYTDSYHKHVELVDKMHATIDEKQKCISDLTNVISIKNSKISQFNSIIENKDRIFNEMSITLINCKKQYDLQIERLNLELKTLLNDYQKINQQFSLVHTKLHNLKRANIPKKTLQIYNKIFSLPNITDYTIAQLPALLSHERLEIHNEIDKMHTEISRLKSISLENQVNKLDFTFLKIEKNQPSTLLPEKIAKLNQKANEFRSKIIFSLDNIKSDEPYKFLASILPDYNNLETEYYDILKTSQDFSTSSTNNAFVVSG